MDHQRIPQQALYWQVPGYKRGPGRPRANWRDVVSKDLQKMGSPVRKQRRQLLTDTDGVGVWPNVSSWIRDESRSRSSIAGGGGCPLDLSAVIHLFVSLKDISVSPSSIKIDKKLANGR